MRGFGPERKFAQAQDEAELKLLQARLKLASAQEKADFENRLTTLKEYYDQRKEIEQKGTEAVAGDNCEGSAEAFAGGAGGIEGETGVAGGDDEVAGGIGGAGRLFKSVLALLLRKPGLRDSTSEYNRALPA